MPNKRKRKSHVGYKARYLAYKTENRRVKNKERKLLKHLLKHPNDKQSEERRPVVSYLSEADKIRKQKVRKHVH